jgi:hypothetical protein
MGKVTLVCIFLVFALLLEDGSSIRKKTEKEEKEDEEIQKAVNASLEAEEKKRKEEDEKTREKKKGKEEGEGEASPTSNFTCPEVEPCPTCPKEKKCPEPAICPKCPEKTECPPVECGPCPKVKPCRPCRECGQCPEEQPCKPCGPGGPDPVVNCTIDDHSDSSPPSTCPVPDGPSMSVPVAIAVGVTAGALVTGMATAVGLILRYTSPFISGFLFVSIIILTWYLSSHHPEVAREFGGRALTLLREAALALNNRVVEVLQRHREQVCVPISSILFKNEFHVPKRKFCTKIFYVTEN